MVIPAGGRNGNRSTRVTLVTICRLVLKVTDAIWNRFQIMEFRPSPASGSAVLDKAMGILNAYAPGDRALTPQAVAERVGLPLPTVYRLMHSLAAHGMLEKTGAGFRLGLALLRLGARVTASIDLRQVVTPYLESLNAATGENAELHVLRGETRVSIESVLSAQNLRRSCKSVKRCRSMSAPAAELCLRGCPPRGLSN